MVAMRTLVTNEAVAQRLDLSHSMVSRIRSDDRLPSWETMVKIHDRLNWDMQDQTDARVLGNYAAEFEKVLAREFG